MDEQLRNSINRSLSELGSLQKKLDNLVDEMPDDMRQVRDTVQGVLKKVGSKLEDSLENGEILSEEAQLQAHLGMMEAKEKLESSRKIFDEYLNETNDQGKTILDELELKAHLAKMQAEDFWERRGPELAQEFKQSREMMRRMSGVAMDEIQTQFKKWNVVFGGKDRSK